MVDVCLGSGTYYQRGGPCTAEDGVEPVSSPHHLSEIRLLRLVLMRNPYIHNDKTKIVDLSRFSILPGVSL